MHVRHLASRYIVISFCLFIAPASMGQNAEREEDVSFSLPIKMVSQSVFIKNPANVINFTTKPWICSVVHSLNFYIYSLDVASFKNIP